MRAASMLPPPTVKTVVGEAADGSADGGNAAAGRNLAVASVCSLMSPWEQMCSVQEWVVDGNSDGRAKRREVEEEEKNRGVCAFSVFFRFLGRESLQSKAATNKKQKQKKKAR